MPYCFECQKPIKLNEVYYDFNDYYVSKKELPTFLEKNKAYDEEGKMYYTLIHGDGKGFGEKVYPEELDKVLPYFENVCNHEATEEEYEDLQNFLSEQDYLELDFPEPTDS